MTAPPPVAYVLDLPYLARRAWHAVERDTPKSRTPQMLGAFANMLVKLLAERRPAYLIAAAEYEGPTWRHALFAGYKASRPPHPAGFDAQVIDAIRLLELHKIPVLAAGGFEADDVIATATKVLRGAGLRVAIVSADKDLRALVTDAAPEVRLWDGRTSTDPEERRKSWVTAARIRKEWGIEPDRVGDLLALTGDDGDDVPGLKGVGPAKAAALLAESQDLEHAIALRRWGDSAPAKALNANVEQVRLARQLVALRDDVPVVVDLAAAEHRASRYDRDGIARFYEAAGLRHLADRLE